MVRFHNKKNNLNLNENFFKLIKYKSFSKKRQYSEVLSTLNQIFETMGKPHLLSLIKFRKLWATDFDSFLSKNSYPRNISLTSKILINSNYLEELKSENLEINLYLFLEKMIGKNFNNLEQFAILLKRKFYRPISKYEMELLKNKVQFEKVQKILHLTVYDGSISYAIRSETEAYLRILNKMLPEIKLDKIQCHVGEIEKMQFYERQLSLLARDWNLITPTDINKKCVPGFLHRISKNRAILVIYVSNQKDLDSLKNNPGADWFLNHLQQKYSELQNVLKKIKFVLINGLDLEKTRIKSFLLGAIHQEVIVEKKNLILQRNNLKNRLTVKENFTKLSKNLK